MDPKLALEITKETAELFRRDYLVASVLVLVVSNIAWAWAMRGVLNRLAATQDKRVEDQIAGEKRAEALLNRMATHMDRSSEASVRLLQEAEALRAQRRELEEATKAKRRGATGT